MGMYRVKADDVEAEKFTGHNWHAIERWLGPHLTKTVENPRDKADVAHYVFDISTKEWQFVPPNRFIVRTRTGALDVFTIEDFEYKWEPVPPVTRGVTYPTQPVPMPTYPTPPYVVNNNVRSSE